MDYEVAKLAFEKAATKKGYTLDRDDVDRYVDNWLQEAWEIFMLIDHSEITKGNEFKSMVLGEFKPDERNTALIDKLSHYYKVSEHMSHLRASEEWKKFKAWAYRNGYTMGDVNRVRQTVEFKFDDRRGK